MATISQSQLTGFLSFMVKNNQSGVSSALSSLGYIPATTGVGLVNQLINIQNTEGTLRLQQIFANVPINQNNTNTSELSGIAQNVTGVTPVAGAKFGWSDFAALWGGSTVVGGSSSTTTTKPAVSSTTIIVVSVVVVIVAFLIYKFA